MHEKGSISLLSQAKDMLQSHPTEASSTSYSSSPSGKVLWIGPLLAPKRPNHAVTGGDKHREGGDDMRGTARPKQQKKYR